MLVQIWSDEDRTPPWNGEVELVDAESGGALRIQVDAEARRRYTEAFDRFCRRHQRGRAAKRGQVRGLPTSMPLEDAIFGTMMRARSIA